MEGPLFDRFCQNASSYDVQLAELSSNSVKEKLDCSALVSVALLQGINAFVEGAEAQILSHVESCTEDVFLVIQVDFSGLVEHDLHFDEELLTKFVSFRTLEAQIDLANFKAGIEIFTQEGFELCSDLNRDV